MTRQSVLAASLSLRSTIALALARRPLLSRPCRCSSRVARMSSLTMLAVAKPGPPSPYAAVTPVSRSATATDSRPGVPRSAASTARLSAVAASLAETTRVGVRLLAARLGDGDGRDEGAEGADVLEVPVEAAGAEDELAAGPGMDERLAAGAGAAEVAVAGDEGRPGPLEDAVSTTRSTTVARTARATSAASPNEARRARRRRSRASPAPEFPTPSSVGAGSQVAGCSPGGSWTSRGRSRTDRGPRSRGYGRIEA